MKSTLDHQEHKSLLDSTEFKGRSHDGEMKSVNLRNSDGILGVQQTAKGYQISSYNNRTDEHLTSEELLFDTEQDARDFVNEQHRDLKSLIVEDHRPKPSVSELQQQEQNRIRRAKEIESGSHIWSNN